MHGAHRQCFCNELGDDCRDRETEGLRLIFAHERSRVLETFECDFVSVLATFPAKEFPGTNAERRGAEYATRPCEPRKRSRDVNRRTNVANVLLTSDGWRCRRRCLRGQTNKSKRKHSERDGFELAKVFHERVRARFLKKAIRSAT